MYFIVYLMYASYSHFIYQSLFMCFVIYFIVYSSYSNLICRHPHVSTGLACNQLQGEVSGPVKQNTPPLGHQYYTGVGRLGSQRNNFIRPRS